MIYVLKHAAERKVLSARLTGDKWSKKRETEKIFTFFSFQVSFGEQTHLLEGRHLAAVEHAQRRQASSTAGGQRHGAAAHLLRVVVDVLPGARERLLAAAAAAGDVVRLLRSAGGTVEHLLSGERKSNFFFACLKLEDPASPRVNLGEGRTLPGS